MTMFLLLRVVHVLCGAIWVGSGLFVAVILAPAAVRGGDAGTALFARLQTRLPVWFGGAALLTVLSGAVLYGRDSMWRWEWIVGPGHGWTIGACAALVAFALGATMPRISERARPVVGGVMGIFLVVALVAMATARYV